MRKVSYILGTLGVISIIISILLLNMNNNGNKITIPWTNEYQKGTINNQNLQEFNESSYKKVIINQDNKFYYIIPENSYLSRVGNNIIEYRNDKLITLRYSLVSNNETMTKMIKEYQNFKGSVEILKYELTNGNILLLVKQYDDHYEETLNLFINLGGGYYYQLSYHIYNVKFSDDFINEIINLEKYQNGTIGNNKEGEWNLPLDIKGKKMFNLKYDSSKYIKDNIYQDYELSLKVNNESNKVVKVIFNYNSSAIEEDINTTYTITNTKDIKLKYYDSKLYTMVDKNNVEYLTYAIKLDSNTKLLITYNKSLEKEVDINNFLNFTYE